MTGPHPIHLDAGDAAELAELLAFLADWLRQDQSRLASSLLSFVGNTSYSIDTLHADLARFGFLLGDNSTQLFGQDQP
ncbi:hypothetical protein [Actinophytocola sp. NPDC049390]|uniref:hypothetical protein n=1 Tax=Actinophytocola sp. NPDC049390 TaxID=3363894 RepID=UPI00379E7454